MMPRWVHRLYAAALGFFWLPCPVCGRMFGGHEWRDRDGLPSCIPTGVQGVGRGICPSCTRNGYGSRPPFRGSS